MQQALKYIHPLVRFHIFYGLFRRERVRFEHRFMKRCSAMWSVWNDHSVAVCVNTGGDDVLSNELRVEDLAVPFHTIGDIDQNLVIVIEFVCDRTAAFPAPTLACLIVLRLRGSRTVARDLQLDCQLLDVCTGYFIFRSQPVS